MQLFVIYVINPITECPIAEFYSGSTDPRLQKLLIACYEKKTVEEEFKGKKRILVNVDAELLITALQSMSLIKERDFVEKYRSENEIYLNKAEIAGL